MDNESKYSQGKRVSHISYGVGTIEKVEIFQGQREALVKFDGGQTRWLLTVQLQLIDKS